MNLNHLSYIERMALLAHGHWIEGGNKTFILSQEMCDSFEHVEVNVPRNEYEQPYPAVQIIFPDGAIAYCVQTELREREGTPLRPTLIFVFFYGKKTFTANFFLDVDRTFENRRFQDEEFFYTANMDILVNAERICINAMLVACNHPTRLVRDPVVNKSFPRRIVEERQAKRREVIEFIDQNIRWIDTAGVSGDGTPREGNHKAPHWRKGHYRRQRFGEGRAGVKWVFIKPVLVNAAYYGGLGSSTVYRRIA